MLVSTSGNFGGFRFYCQKILPAVYDDSLSYYELVCKLDQYIKELTEVTNTQSDAIKELQDTLAEFMAGTFDPYIEEKVDEWFEEHEPELTDIITNLQINFNHSSMYGGDATLIFDIFDIDENLTLDSYHTKISRDKATNMLHFDIVIRNATQNYIHLATSPLFKLKNFFMRRYNTLDIYMPAMIYRFTSDSNMSLPSTRVLESAYPANIKLVRDGNDAGVYVNYNMGYNRELVINGEAPIASLFSWLCSSFFNNELCASVCSYFLHGPGGSSDSWEGELIYGAAEGMSTVEWNNARIDPTSGRSDCSGITYMAYKNFGFHPQNTVQQSYLTDGIFVAYAPAGEKLDLSNARPGDIICYQRADDEENYPVESYISWTHCSIYAGNNVTYEMAKYYPEIETRAGHIDGYGPYMIETPADEYRMNAEVNSITNHSSSGFNRCVVRFM